MLLSLRAKNCITGSISSRSRGMVSPGRRYRLVSTASKTCLSFSSDEGVTTESLEPPQTSTGVLHLLINAAGTSPGNPPPILMTPPSSSSNGDFAA